MNDSIEACNAGNAILGISRYQNRFYDTSLDSTPRRIRPLVEKAHLNPMMC